MTKKYLQHRANCSRPDSVDEPSLSGRGHVERCPECRRYLYHGPARPEPVPEPEPEPELDTEPPRRPGEHVCRVHGVPVTPRGRGCAECDRARREHRSARRARRRAALEKERAREL